MISNRCARRAGRGIIVLGQEGYEVYMKAGLDDLSERIFYFLKIIFNPLLGLRLFWNDLQCRRF